MDFIQVLGLGKSDGEAWSEDKSVVKAKLGRKTNVCLLVALVKAMCATMRCASSGCMGLGLGVGTGGIELPRGPGHAVPGKA